MMLVGSLEVPRKALLPEANSVKIRYLTHSEAEQKNLLYILCCSTMLVLQPTPAQFKPAQVTALKCAVQEFGQYL